MPKSVPAFLGIGAPRSGTTWLYEQMRHHRELWLPPLKELHWFDRDRRYVSPSFFAPQRLRDRMFGTAEDRRTQRHFLRRALQALRHRNLEEFHWWTRVLIGRYDQDFYQSLFPAKVGGRLPGEITPAYSILDPADIARIARINKDMRLIFMVRDPVEREWSAIRANVSRGHLDLDLRDADAVLSYLQVRAASAGPNGQLARGQYDETLRRYLDIFPPEQLLVGFYDAIALDPEGLLAGIARHLGISEFNATRFGKLINASPPETIPEAVAEWLALDNARLIEASRLIFGSYAMTWGNRSYRHNLAPTLSGDRIIEAL
jgi:hypothetical protein